MSTRRLTVLIESLVCSVDRTRWPVIAARTPISAVSGSRISPTMITSGSWRSAERSTRANVSSMRGLTCTWLMRGMRYSTGSSTVMILCSGTLTVFSAAYSVVVLPLPVGPVTRIMPLGRCTRRSMRTRASGGMPSWSRFRMLLDWSSRRMTIDSPWATGMVDRRMSMRAFLTLIWKRPSCGRRFSEMSRPDISFRRVTSAEAMRVSSMICSCRKPSMRWRTRSRFSSGSMWMSDACTCVASSNMDCSSRTTGASSAVTVASVSAAMSYWPCAISSPSSSASVTISSVRR
jgi:hypothetical protein